MNKCKFSIALFTLLTLCILYSNSAFAAWSYRKSHVVQAGAGTGTDYQIRIRVHYDQAGTDSGEDVYLNSNCQANFGDVRFVDDDNFTELDYWLEEIDTITNPGFTSAVFWVKINDDLSTLSQTIYVYYGTTPITSTTSNGDRTFIFFDDFNQPLNTTTKWALQQPRTVAGVTYPRAEPVGSETYLRCGGGVTGNPYGWTCLGSTTSYADFQNNAVEYRYRVSANAIAEVSFRGDFDADTGYKARSDQRNNEGQSLLKPPYTVGVWQFISGAGQDGVRPLTALPTPPWYRGTITANGSSLNFVTDVIGSLTRSATDTDYPGPGQISLQNHYGLYSDYDWVAVRKFTGTEPAHGAWGLETAIPTSEQTQRNGFDFDGTDDFIEVEDNASLDLAATGTLEAWVYMFGTSSNAGIIHKGDGATNEAYSLRFGGTNNDQIQMIVNDGTASDTALSTTTILTNTWYHVAGTWDNTTTNSMAIYINGVQDNTAACNRNAVNLSEKLIIGAQNDTGANAFYGIIDEAKVWSDVRTQTEIQDYMCRKLIGSEANLEGNWRLDEVFSSTCLDQSANINTGFTNTATRTCSSAPIGDDSAHDYIGSSETDFEINGIPASLDITSSYGDYVQVTGDGGDWNSTLKSCVHLYRVDGPPNYTSAPLLWKSLSTSPHYWGVFKSGGTDPTYEMVYHYDGYPDISNENNLQMAFRKNNCDQWKGLNATLSLVNQTLTKSELNGTEFILGQNIDPRNAIDFDGTDDFVDCGNPAVFDITDDITIEAWVFPDAWFAPYAGIISKRTQWATMDWELYYNIGSSRLEFWYGPLGTNQLFQALNVSLATGIWQHIAVTNSGDDWSLYINGVLQGTETNAAALPTGDHLIFGLLSRDAPTPGNSFDGKIDDVRIWNIARTQAQIRDTMCQKLAGTESGLVGYWRFDEETDSCICPDMTANGNDGTMTNFGTCPSDAIRNARTCSSAPIGDDSAYDYFDLGAGVSAQLAHSDGDYMLVNENSSGTWTDPFSGLHIYRLDEVPIYPPDLWDDTYYTYQTPNGMTPPTNWSSIDYYRYWGVFVTDQDATNAPTYDVNYYYNGNPSVPAGADGSASPSPQIGLAKRPGYCFGTWADPPATWDSGNLRLRLLGEYQFGTPGTPLPTNPEYVLGGINQPLAIALASFYAEFDKFSDCIRITWQTATEVDTIGFQLWRSDTEEGPYALVSGSFMASQSVSETTGAEYSYLDCDVDLETYMTFYYKLEEIDMDNTKDNLVYGPIGPVTETVGASQLNKKTSSNVSSGGGCFIKAIF